MYKLNLTIFGDCFIAVESFVKVIINVFWKDLTLLDYRTKVVSTKIGSNKLLTNIFDICYYTNRNTFWRLNMFTIPSEIMKKINEIIKRNANKRLVANTGVVFSCGCYADCRNTCGESCYQKN